MDPKANPRPFYPLKAEEYRSMGATIQTRPRRMGKSIGIRIGIGIGITNSRRTRNEMKPLKHGGINKMSINREEIV